MIRLRSGGKMTARAFKRLKAQAQPRWLDGDHLEGNIETAARLWNSGWNQGQIAEALGLTASTVRMLLVEARILLGVELRRYRGKLPGEPRARTQRPMRPDLVAIVAGTARLVPLELDDDEGSEPGGEGRCRGSE